LFFANVGIFIVRGNGFSLFVRLGFLIALCGLYGYWYKKVFFLLAVLLYLITFVPII
jgi:hypothetical protein